LQAVFGLRWRPPETALGGCRLARNWRAGGGPISLDESNDAADWPKQPRLTCVECGATTKRGQGWKTDPAVDDEGVDEPEVAVYCPACWRREFGRWR